MKASDIIRALQLLGEDCGIVIGDGRILYWRESDPSKIYVLQVS